MNTNSRAVPRVLGTVLLAGLALSASPALAAGTDQSPKPPSHSAPRTIPQVSGAVASTAYLKATASKAPSLDGSLSVVAPVASDGAEPVAAETTPGGASTPAVASDAVTSDVIATAMSGIGVPYVWAGSTTSGWDCSGFTSWVYAKHGIYLPHSSTKQGAMGTTVSQAQAQPGDIVHWPGHVGIYAGNGEVIDAGHTPMSTTRRGIWGSPTFVHIADFNAADTAVMARSLPAEASRTENAAPAETSKASKPTTKTDKPTTKRSAAKHVTTHKAKRAVGKHSVQRTTAKHTSKRATAKHTHHGSAHRTKHTHRADVTPRTTASTTGGTHRR